MPPSSSHISSPQNTPYKPSKHPPPPPSIIFKLGSSIMGVITYEMEVTSSIPPAKMFKASVLDADNLIPKILPQAIKNVEIIQGDGGPGTIKKIYFGEGQFALYYLLGTLCLTSYVTFVTLWKQNLFCLSLKRSNSPGNSISIHHFCMISYQPDK